MHHASLRQLVPIILGFFLAIIAVSSIPMGNHSRGNPASLLPAPHPSLGGVNDWNVTYLNDYYDVSDAGNAVAVDPTSGNIVYVGATGGGSTTSAFYETVLPNGTTISDNSWPGLTGLSFASATGISFDSNGFMYLEGSTISPGGNESAFVATYYPGVSSSQRWVKTWGGQSAAGDWGHGVAVDASGNAFLAGTTNSYGAGNGDAFLAKYNHLDGTLLWNKTWGGMQSEDGNAVAVDANGSAFLAGETETYAKIARWDAFIAKYAPDGTQLWNQTWGGANSFGTTFGESVVVDSSGNAYMAGLTDGFTGGNYAAFIAKYAPDGTQLWNRTWTDGPHTVGSNSITLDANGNIFLGGATYNLPGVTGGNSSAYVTMFTPNGILLWNRTWDYGGFFDSGQGVAVGASGGIYLEGTAGYHKPTGQDSAFLAKFTYIPITVKTPNPGTVFGAPGLTFNVTVPDSPLPATWYTVGTSNINHTFTPGTLTPVATFDWSMQPDGPVQLQFWANDTQGNMAYTSVIVVKNTTAPTITIIGPTIGQVFGADAPTFSLNITDPNLNGTWYSLDGGVTNTTCRLTGTLAAQWDAQGNGTVTVTFWANNTLGNVGTASVLVQKVIGLPFWELPLWGLPLWVFLAIIEGAIALLAVLCIYFVVRHRFRRRVIPAQFPSPVSAPAGPTAVPATATEVSPPTSTVNTPAGPTVPPADLSQVNSGKLLQKVRRILRTKYHNTAVEFSALQEKLNVPSPTIQAVVDAKKPQDLVFILGGAAIASNQGVANAINFLRKDHKSVALSEVEDLIHPIGQPIKVIVDNLIREKRVRAQWVDPQKFEFTQEPHKKIWGILVGAVTAIYLIINIITFLISNHIL